MDVEMDFFFKGIVGFLQNLHALISSTGRHTYLRRAVQGGSYAAAPIPHPHADYIVGRYAMDVAAAAGNLVAGIWTIRHPSVPVTQEGMA